VETTIKIMLVDDHEIVRQGLAAVLGVVEDFQIIGQAGSQREAVDTALRCGPDIILMDVRLPDGSGIEACREILAKMPNVRVIMLTSYPDDEAVFASIMAGASGYLLKEVSAVGIVDGIKAVAAGGSLLDPGITGKVLRKLRHRPTENENKFANLTDKERQILDLIAQGKTNKEIASEVFLSDKTVKNYVSKILSKLQLGRRSAAAAFVTEIHAEEQKSRDTLRFSQEKDDG